MIIKRIKKWIQCRTRLRKARDYRRGYLFALQFIRDNGPELAEAELDGRAWEYDDFDAGIRAALRTLPNTDGAFE